MHYAKLHRSIRLQRLLNFLSDGQPHTTKEIGDATGIEAVGSAIGELRRNGISITCARRTRVESYRGRGTMVYEYQIERE